MIERDTFSLPRGVKPHIMPRYDCPPNSVYYGWNMTDNSLKRLERSKRDRFEIVCPINENGHIWGGFKVARELWRPV